MLKIGRFAVEGLTQGCVTDDSHPHFSFSLESDRENVSLKAARLSLNGWSGDALGQIGIPYLGPALKPYSVYEAIVSATDDAGETAVSSVTFETGKLDAPWKGRWISDGSYHFKEKKVSPKPMLFHKNFRVEGAIRSAKAYVTALGIYELELNGRKVGNRYFAPGFTSYAHRLQYQIYDIGPLLKKGANELYVTVAGGWAVGSFTITRANRFAADRQALLLELCLSFEDGREEIIASDESFDVSEEGPLRAADFYDGEEFDASMSQDKIPWRKAKFEKLRVHPSIIAESGSPVIAHEKMRPVAVFAGPSGETIYDFGQNFAGVAELRFRGRKGQQAIIRHAEILNERGGLEMRPLRSAKAMIIYHCRGGGEETYSPSFTYMGFRYLSVEGIAPQDIDVSALALYSDLERIGAFHCSDERLNRLNENVVWSSKSNFMDIPTDCPQRDERMGWTGDIGLFAPTACHNFEMSRFLGKWLEDLKAEQARTGGLPNTVPTNGYGFPTTMPKMAIDFWGDACLYVPWSLYMAYGDARVLASSYEAMRKYVDACAFWAKIWGVGKYRYIWHTPAALHFGDWVAPDCQTMSEWQKRSKFTATASLMRTSSLLAEIAAILGRKEDAAHYGRLAQKVAKAYREVFTKEPGLLKNEFQTAYVLPIAFGIFEGEEKQKAVANLVRLVEKNGYRIGTGFPGTPFLLFALADNGAVDVAYKMLRQEEPPSWLYEVRMGATTIWEKFDGLDEKGHLRLAEDGTGGMISFNHYAFGSVAAFLYERVAGLEALKPGYKEFQIRPLLGGGLTEASISLASPYGLIESAWRIVDGVFSLNVRIPPCTRCRIALPSGKMEEAGSGVRHFEEPCAK
jgi:alpha-L-rhamnosidase